jgi:cell fate regulator YaaT (PSP1 superfamily)
MGCSNCNNGGGLPKGCKNNGSCGVDGCNKLTVFDWLSNMELPGGQQPFDWVEVRFKNGRKEFYKNVNNLSLHIGDIIAVEGQPGHDIGSVSLTGELVRIQMRKKKAKTDDEHPLKVYRKASQRDLDRWAEVQQRETEVMYKSREMAKRLALNMKISDVEFQGDGSKATFYYTAESRIDFRQLIKDMATAFGVRVEMRQIGARQEAARLGGIGSCGRELCCSTWLTDFRSVNTSAARYQQLSLNPQKLAGQCGKLKCCLNYELDSYLDALKDFPDMGVKLKTKKGTAICQKQDIFKRQMWFAFEDAPLSWVPVAVDRVNEILEMNKMGQEPESLEQYAELVDATPDYGNVVGQDSLTRFDNKKGKRRSNRRSRNKQNNRNANNRGKKK